MENLYSNPVGALIIRTSCNKALQVFEEHERSILQTEEACFERTAGYYATGDKVAAKPSHKSG